MHYDDFPEMTPELKAYLNHQNGLNDLVNTTYPPFRKAEMVWESLGRPASGSEFEEKERLSKIHYGGLDRFRQKGKDLASSLPEGLLNRYIKAKRALFFTEENKVKESKKSHQEGDYRLTIHKYKTTEGGWAYSQGIVENIVSGETIAKINRNYGSFPFVFYKNRYLICGEDYQSITVLDLQTGEQMEQFLQFCSRTFSPAPEGNIIAIEGCFWGGPGEVIFYTFDDPLKEWKRCRYPNDEDWRIDNIKWISSTTAELGRDRLYCHIINKYMDENETAEDMEFLEKYCKENNISEEQEGDMLYRNEWQIISVLDMKDLVKP